MKRNRDGSLLIVVLVAVSVVTMLALALGSWIRTRVALADERAYQREVRLGCRNAAFRFFEENLLSDTNGWDALSEDWAKPWDRRDDGWVMRVSGSGWNADPRQVSGVKDEAGKLPVNASPPAVVASLLSLAAGLPEETAKELAGRIADWRDGDDRAEGDNRRSEAERHVLQDTVWDSPNRDFAAIEELRLVPGMTPVICDAVLPYLTAAPVTNVNINTASEMVMEAVLLAVGTGDAYAARSLFNRIRAFRGAGSAFTSATAAQIGKDLGGLPADEAILLSACEARLTVEADVFSGVVEATPGRVWESGRRGGRAFFTWQRSTRRFLLWAEE